ncbi:MAG: PHP domain-containing protein [Anaerolineae bacterium]|nr:PHP domain-containing protein [Anaerolineae bacterium]MCI0611147.1 PHP domain-containing protein [Anaerolineae bacterium]
MGFADLHIHTIYSYDGTASVPAVLTQARKLGLDVIAITDHDEIAGSLKALSLAPRYGVDVIPGIEITTSEGDLLALNVTEKLERDLPLIETVLRVGELGGFCIAPHPMAYGIGMKSLSAYSILRALRNMDVADILIGIETYNATTIDRMSNRYAHILAEHLDMAQIGNSDAHIVEAIGLAVTEFPGSTGSELVKAIHKQKTMIHKKKEWNAVRILGSWAARYLGSTFARRAVAAQ